MTAFPLWFAAPDSNADVGGVSVAEGMEAKHVNNAMRQIMGQLETFFAKGDTITAGATTDLGAENSQYLTISGTTAITSFGTPANAAEPTYILRFAAATPITHNGATLILPGAVSVTAVVGEVAAFHHEGSGVWRCITYPQRWLIGDGVAGQALISNGPNQPPSFQSSAALPVGYFSGLTISNNGADANNDIDFAAGIAKSSDGTADLVLAGVLTKRLDAVWAIGNNQGGLFSGSKANSTWYHCFLIKRPDTGVVDCGFDTSITAANIPANYTKYRRIGSVLTDSSGNIRAFVEAGADNIREFYFNTAILDRDDVNPGTAAVLRALSTPPGVRVKAILNVGTLFSVSNSNTFAGYISDPAIADAAPLGSSVTPAVAPGANFIAASFINTWTWQQLCCWTNASSQVRVRIDTSVASTRVALVTNGWADFL